MLLRPQHRRQRPDLALAIAVERPHARQAPAQLLEHRHRHDRRAVIDAAQRGQVAAVEIGMPQQADPHRRGREERRDAAFLDQPQHKVRSRRLDQMRGGADQHLRQREAVHLRRVIQRQGRQRDIGAAELQLNDAAGILRHQRPMRHHGALRGRRGARGVEQLGEIAVVDVRHLQIWPGFIASDDQHVEFAVGRAREAAVKIHRHLGPDRRHRGGKIRIVDQRARARLLDDVFEFAGGQRVVDRHVDEARSRAGQPEDQVGIRVAGIGRDPIALLQPATQQPVRHPAGRAVQRHETPGPVAEGQRGAVAKFRHRAPDPVSDRIAAQCARPGRSRRHLHPPVISCQIVAGD